MVTFSFISKFSLHKLIIMDRTAVFPIFVAVNPLKK